METEPNELHRIHNRVSCYRLKLLVIVVPNSLIYIFIIIIFSPFSVYPGYTESLDDDIEIVVPEGDHGLYAIDILDPSLVRMCFCVKSDFCNV